MASTRVAKLIAISNVQVTLQILRALIDKSPRDLPLYAPYVLRILGLVLKSRDFSMIEDSIPTFQTFCEHQDVGILVADQELAKQYEEVVKYYASFATKPPSPAKGTLSTPVAIRWKAAGLQALKSVSSSDAVGADPGRQLDIVIPVLLENLYSNSEDRLHSLNQKANAEKESAIRRRMSIATVRTSESAPEPSNPPVSATAADADRLAVEEAELIALQSLKQIFTANNRVQIRLATNSMLRFLMEKPMVGRPGTAKAAKSGRILHWPTMLVEMVTKWTPVQDRFIIIVTAMETLVKSPASEENMEKQLTLAGLVESLLGSTINMIGLSVMDVLLGLIQHILLLLQLGGKGSNVLPHYQQTDAIDLFRGPESSRRQTTIFEEQEEGDVAQASTPSSSRQELLSCLQRCIANLATHVYYSDQISDIISAILLRLKPSPMSNVGSAATAIENPSAAAQAISDSINMKEDTSTDEFFSFGTARVTALKAIRDVIIIANKKGPSVGAGAIGRNRVAMNVWEGTQWLLRDDDRRVRHAYVDALLTWLKLELTKDDLRILAERPKSKKRTDGQPEKPATVATRAISAPQGGRSKSGRSTFLRLIHLAIYNNALESPETDSDMLILHLLLVSLVENLGVNAVKSGFSMIVRLQEDIDSPAAINTPKAKINVGSVVYGYFWCLSRKFELDTTMVGYDIHGEIARRQKANLWLQSIQIPPLPVDRIILTGPSLTDDASASNSQQESLKPFENIPSMVDLISSSYSASVVSAPSSPLASPGRVLSTPVVTQNNALATVEELPPSFKSSMLAKWSKEDCIASVESERARTISPHGSRTGTTNSANNKHLSVNGNTPWDVSPADGLSRSRTRESSPNLAPIQTSQHRRSSPQISGPPTPPSSSDQTHTIRVDDLKKVLAGGALAEAFSNHPRRISQRGASPLRNSSTAYHDFGNSTTHRMTGPSLISAGSDSFVDAEGFESASEGDLDHALPSPQTPLTSTEMAQQYLQHFGRRRAENGNRQENKHDLTDKEQRAVSRGRSRSGSDASVEDAEANAKALKGELVPPVVRGSIVAEEGVPPVPPLPRGLLGNISLATSTAESSRRGGEVETEVSKAGSISSGSWRKEGSVKSSSGRRMMIHALLGSIEVGGGGRRVGKPPE